MPSLEPVCRYLQSRGVYPSFRLGPCGQWKCRLYDAAGHKRWEGLAPSVERALVLALRQVDYARR